MGRGYRPELDGLRALAVLLVIAYHTSVPGFGGGSHGVDVFFVLSGHLITGLLLRRPSYGHFMVRRARRLYPALLAVSFVFAAALLSPTGVARTNWWDVLQAVSYTTNYFAVDGQSALKHTWSLAVEAQFYLLWPLIIPLITKSRQPSVVLLLMWAGMTVVRMLYFASTGDRWGSYAPLHMHATGLVLGALVAFSGPGRLSWLGVAGIIATTLALSPQDHSGRILWGTPIVEVSTALVLSGLAQAPRLSKLLSSPVLVWVGVLSYGMYLWHIPIQVLVDGRLWWVQFAFTLVISAMTAAFSYFVIERPFRTDLRAKIDAGDENRTLVPSPEVKV
jgi:peptidoglycan/LPS O-acetylase OafA/YrhL